MCLMSHEAKELSKVWMSLTVLEICRGGCQISFIELMTNKVVTFYYDMLDNVFESQHDAMMKS